MGLRPDLGAARARTLRRGVRRRRGPPEPGGHPRGPGGRPRRRRRGAPTPRPLDVGLRAGGAAAAGRRLGHGLQARAVTDMSGKETHMSEHRSFVPRVLLRGGQSHGAIAIVEVAVPPRWQGPPLHHHAFDEAFYVLDGELTFQLGNELRTATPGQLVFAPRDAHHTLANLSAAPARYLLVCTPAGFERYFDRLAAEAAGTEPPASAREPYPETVVVG